MHKSLNSTQGRIFSRKIIDISEDELLKSLEDQKVIEIRKLSRREGENYIPTGAAIVTFDLIHRPDYLKLGWERVRVVEYVSNPMRCINCQRLGHTRKRCRNIELCRNCGLTLPHDPCTRKFCVNCNNETHTSFDSSCPSFLKHKSVNKIKTDKRCTIREAWAIFNDNPTLHTLKPFSKTTQTYSEILRNKPTEDQNLNKNTEDAVSCNGNKNSLVFNNKCTTNNFSNNNNCNNIVDTNPSTSNRNSTAIANSLTSIYNNNTNNSTTISDSKKRTLDVFNTEKENNTSTKIHSTNQSPSVLAFDKVKEMPIINHDHLVPSNKQLNIMTSMEDDNCNNITNEKKNRNST